MALEASEKACFSDILAVYYQNYEKMTSCLTITSVEKIVFGSSYHLTFVFAPDIYLDWISLGHQVTDFFTYEDAVNLFLHFWGMS